MDEPKLEITRRRLPHWRISGSVYFITFRLLAGRLEADERQIVFDHIRAGEAKFYELYGFVVMPDHVHVALRPKAELTLSRIMKGMKGASARLVNASRGATGTLWQDESFDRIIRDEIEFLQKLEYMANNPVKAGLVTDPQQYPYSHFAVL